jgi:type IX secretion system PorP/SprF family membrane protein
MSDVFTTRLWHFNRTNRFLLFAVVLCMGFSFQYAKVYGQDIHFTQFFTNPLLLNPAQTGNYAGNYRFGFNAKMQWPWAISQRVYNYHTEAPYADISFLEDKIKRGWMGLGFVFLNDEAGDGALTYRRFGLSYAYHQSFDKEDRYVLSAGFMFNYILRSVDFSKFYFNNQWVDDDGFNLSIDPTEPYTREAFGMIDLGTGVSFGAQVHKQTKLNFGVSVLHLNRPKHSFYNSTDRLGIRYCAQGGIVFQVNEILKLQGDLFFSYQTKATETMLGIMAGYSPGRFKNNKPLHTIYFGSYYRIKDALSPIVGYQFGSARILLNYDIVISKLTPQSRANGGPEVSFVYVGSWRKNYNGRKVFCPRF